jgi:Protein of unknown function (DUF3040)
VLSDDERRALAEIERSLQDAGPAERAGRSPVARALTRTGVGLSILLLLVGVPVAAFALGTATASGWLLWHWWPQLAGRPAAPPLVGQQARQRCRRCGHRVLEQLARMAEVQFGRLP